MTRAQRMDRERMYALAQEVEALRRDGRWTEVEFNRISDLAVEAARGVPGARDWLLDEAEPEWIDRRLA